jgi:hypothetical protein
VKKGRHRRYEEARALKRGGDLDIESIFNDLSGERPTDVDVDVDVDVDDAELDEDDYEDALDEPVER